MFFVTLLFDMTRRITNNLFFFAWRMLVVLCVEKFGRSNLFFHFFSSVMFTDKN